MKITCDPDCSWNNQEFDIQSENQTIETFEYSCLEQHPYWGRLTLSFTFLPGVALFIRLLKSKEVRKSVCKIIFALLASLTFPLTLFVVKTISIFQFGEEWKRVATLVTVCEGHIESLLQACLQCYVIYARPDLQASVFQLLAVGGSFIMIGFGQVKAAFANRTPEESACEDIKKIAVFTFSSFAMIGFFVFGAVTIALFDKVIFFVSYGTMAILYLTFLLLTRLKPSCLPQTSSSKKKLKYIMLSVAFFIQLINCIIIHVLFNMDPDSYSKVTFFETQSAGNLYIGIYFTPFNLIMVLNCFISAFSEKFRDFLRIYGRLFGLVYPIVAFLFYRHVFNAIN